MNLNRKLQTALVSTEIGPFSFKDTSSCPKPKNEPFSLGTASKAEQCEREELEDKMAQNSLPPRLSYYVYRFHTKSAKVAQYFSSKGWPVS